MVDTYRYEDRIFSSFKRHSLRWACCDTQINYVW